MGGNSPGADDRWKGFFRSGSVDLYGSGSGVVGEPLERSERPLTKADEDEVEGLLRKARGNQARCERTECDLVSSLRTPSHVSDVAQVILGSVYPVHRWRQADTRLADLCREDSFPGA